ncbi:hypothetical protein [Brevundimonas sp.]|nr:hypothetical protein [Brevundimonas sp.]
MSQITLLTGERRRIFSEEQKLAILEEYASDHDRLLREVWSV